MKAPSPLLGFNNNVRHKGRVFHIQTEDSGIRHPHVITHLFADGGRILKTTKTSYAEHIGQERLSETVRAMMQEQHKAMFIALRDGQFDYLFEEPAGPLSAKAPAKPAAAPVPEAAAARDPEGAEPKAAPKVDEVSAGMEPAAPLGDAAAPKSSPKVVADAAPVVKPPPKAHEAATSRPAAEAARPAPRAAGHAPAAPPADPSPAPKPPAPPAAAPPAPLVAAPPDLTPKRPVAMPARKPPVRSAPHVPAALADPVQRGVVPAAPAAPLVAEAPVSDVASIASRRRARPTLEVDPAAIHGVSSGEPAIDLDLDALERAAAEAQPHVFQQIQDLPPPPASVLGSKRGASGGGYSVQSPSPPPPGRRPPDAEPGANRPPQAGGPPPGRAVQLPPHGGVAPMASQSAGARYAPSRPASIFATTRPQEGASIFGEDLISEKSLDEVILGYLAEDLDGPAEKK